MTRPTEVSPLVSLLQRDDHVKWFRAVFGDQSLLAQALAPPPTAKGQAAQPDCTALRKLLADAQKEGNWSRVLGYANADEATQTANGLLAALEVGAALQKEKEALFGQSASQAACVKSLTQSVECFRAAWWPATQTATGGNGGPARGLLGRLFAAAKIQRGDRSADIVWDLLDRWVHPVEFATDAGQARHAVTPILLAASDEPDPNGLAGTVLWLHVELHPFERGTLVPDVARMGLTTLKGKGGKDSFLDSFAEVWELSQLGRRFRGRWWLGSVPPPPASRSGSLAMQAATRTPHVPHLYGPSAQAALLCALLAASGDPYNDPRDAAAASHASPPEPLLGVAAISAALGERPAGKSLTDVPLLPVGSTNTKLDQAKIQKLDTVIFSENQGLSDEAQQWKADRAAAEAAHRQYAGLHIERAGTVGEALNTLLVCNQYQKAYQEQIARQWRDQWLPPTGEWDPKPQSAAPATT